MSTWSASILAAGMWRNRCRVPPYTGSASSVHCCGASLHPFLDYKSSSPLELDIMSMPVRIDEFLYEDAKRHAKAEARTISGQIEFWGQDRLGRLR